MARESKETSGIVLLDRLFEDEPHQPTRTTVVFLLGVLLLMVLARDFRHANTSSLSLSCIVPKASVIPTSYLPALCHLIRHVHSQMYLNILSLTPLFIATAFPSSYSSPLAPPSPLIPSSFNFSSSSSSRIVFFLDYVLATRDRGIPRSNSFRDRLMTMTS